MLTEPNLDVKFTSDDLHIRQFGRLTAPILDRMADAELQIGRHRAAERLAALAADLREARP